jgi:hypothetical protein
MSGKRNVPRLYQRLGCLTVLLLSSAFSGCDAYIDKIVIHRPTCVPVADSVLVTGLGEGGAWHHAMRGRGDSAFASSVSAFDRHRGYMSFDPIILYAPEGYLPDTIHPSPVELSSALLRSGSTVWSWYNSPFGNVYDRLHDWYYPDTVRFQRDPNFPGFDNGWWVAVNSEPPGARIYCSGKLLGTTPSDTLKFRVGPGDYARGYLNKEVTLMRGGYFPKTCTLTIVLRDAQRYTKGIFVMDRLLVLDRDPTSPLEPYVQPGSAAPPGSASRSSPVSSTSDDSERDRARRQAYSEAEREYAQALSAWKKAKTDYDNAVGNRDIVYKTNENEYLRSCADGLVRSMQTELDIARERLDRAKAKLQALEWK